MPDQLPPRDPVEQLADEFAARYRRGEAPTVAEYAANHPQYALRILELFPTIVMLERYRTLETADRNALCRQ